MPDNHSEDLLISNLATMLSDAGKLVMVLGVIPAAFIVAGPLSAFVTAWAPVAVAWLREPFGWADALVAGAVVAGYALGRFL